MSTFYFMKTFFYPAIKIANKKIFFIDFIIFQNLKKKLNNDCIKKSSRKIEVLVDFGF